ncbi:MAG: hypothetical protein EHM46_02510, partial [Bacteroidetes bacterium]
ISGRVSDPEGRPVMYANVFIEGSYDGTMTDSAGNFSFRTDAAGQQLLTASCVGYESCSRAVHMESGDTIVRLVIRETASDLDEVVITAGTFSAGDKKKSATMSSFDIASTASALGDIYGAYATMPGSQKVGEDGMLFVRGGESYETKTCMDGMPVRSPYFSRMPDVPTRGRFSPLLFSETVFSTGGYSAEYGDALSSIVDLTTNGLEPEDKTSISLMSVGGNVSAARRWKRNSLAGTGMVAFNGLHHKLFKPNVEWTRDPVLGDGMLMYRHSLGETGLLKSFLSCNYSSLAMIHSLPGEVPEKIDLTDHAIYANTTYTDQAGPHWLIKAGASFSMDRKIMVYNSVPVVTLQREASLKMVATLLLSDQAKIRTGAHLPVHLYRQSIDLDSVYILEHQDFSPSLFIEGEFNISGQLALRPGIRCEHSTLTGERALLPRISAAFRTGSHSQVSLAWGKFSQKPLDDYLKLAPWLGSERADHYILNFQYKKERRNFRIEAYRKNYRGLVKYQDPYSMDPDNFNNRGDGRAYGMDLFWRDRESIRGADYWISYSFLKTTRNYRDYPYGVTPSYASAHNVSVVYKQFINPIHTFAGITWSYASGRPYDDRNSGKFMTGRTPAYHDISLNITYLTRLFGRESIVHLNVTNLLGTRHIFGYRYSGLPDEEGIYASSPVVPAIGRQAVLLVMISL